MPFFRSSCGSGSLSIAWMPFSRTISEHDYRRWMRQMLPLMVVSIHDIFLIDSCRITYHTAPWNVQYWALMAYTDHVHLRLTSTQTSFPTSFATYKQESLCGTNLSTMMASALATAVKTTSEKIMAPFSNISAPICWVFIAETKRAYYYKWFGRETTTTRALNFSVAATVLKITALYTLLEVKK